jgi:tRNA(Ile)-lysidine synthase TilS/MesJ
VLAPLDRFTILTMANRAIPLYRSLLRVHKKHLPVAMKELGNTYIKSEFRLHKSAKPDQAEKFVEEWEKYREQILSTARARDSRSSGSLDNSSNTSGGSTAVFDYGVDLSPDADLSEEQVEQLKQLREEATRAGKPGKEN